MVIKELMGWKYTREYCENNNFGYFEMLNLRSLLENKNTSNGFKKCMIDNQINVIRVKYLGQQNLTEKERQRFLNCIEKCKLVLNELEKRTV